MSAEHLTPSQGSVDSVISTETIAAVDDILVVDAFQDELMCPPSPHAENEIHAVGLGAMAGSRIALGDATHSQHATIARRQHDLQRRAALVTHSDSSTDDESFQPSHRQPVASLRSTGAGPIVAASISVSSILETPERTVPPAGGGITGAQSLDYELSSPPLLQFDVAVENWTPTHQRLAIAGGVAAAPNTGNDALANPSTVSAGTALEYFAADGSQAAVTLDPSTSVSMSVIAIDASSDEDITPAFTVSDSEDESVEGDDGDIILADYNDLMLADNDDVTVPGNDVVVMATSQQLWRQSGVNNAAAVPSTAAAAADVSTDDIVVVELTPASSRSPAGEPSATSAVDMSMAEFQSVKPKKRSRVEMEELDDKGIEEGNQCMICFEEWTNAGPHRIAALKCGHLFGFSCIDRWVRSDGTCPQCKAKSKRAEIRKLYANKISALDTAERDRAMQLLEDERKERLRVEQVAAQFQLQNKLLQQECQRMKQQLAQQQQKMQAHTGMARVSSSSGLACGGGSSAASTATAGSGLASAAASGTGASTKSFAQYKNVCVAQAEARVMDFDRSNGIMVVSRPSARENQLVRGFGLVKVLLSDSRHMEYVNIHTQRIRDVCVSRDSIALTASEDKSLRLTSLISNAVVQKYSVPASAWSCCWHREDPQYFFAGLQNNKVLLFDTRNTAQHVAEVGAPVSGDQQPTGSAATAPPPAAFGPPLSGPVVAMSHITPGPPGSGFRDDGLLVCRTTGLSFYRHNAGAEYSAVPLLQGNMYSLSWQPAFNHGLVSIRPGKNHARVQHMLFQLTSAPVGGVTGVGADQSAASGLAGLAMPVAGQPHLNCVMPLTGGVSARSLSKSCLFTHPDRCNAMMACVPDESSKGALVFDCQQGGELQRLTCLSSGQRDIVHARHFHHGNDQFIAALTETNMGIFKWS